MPSPSVSVAIMAHKKRAHLVPALATKLDHPTKVIWDTNNNRWDTGAAAIAAHNPNATHHLVIQDDAIIPTNLITTIENALPHIPDNTPLSLYIGRVRPFRLQVARITRQARGEASFITMPRINWGVAIIYPTATINDLLAHCGKRHEANYDHRASTYYERHRIRTWYTWPSLTDHRDEPSLVPGRTCLNRHAHQYIGDDATLFDPTRRVLHMRGLNPHRDRAAKS